MFVSLAAMGVTTNDILYQPKKDFMHQVLLFDLQVYEMEMAFIKAKYPFVRWVDFRIERTLESYRDLNDDKAFMGIIKGMFGNDCTSGNIISCMRANTKVDLDGPVCGTISNHHVKEALMHDPRDTYRADLQLIQEAGFVYMEGASSQELHPPMEFFVYKTHAFVREAMRRGQMKVVPPSLDEVYALNSDHIFILDQHDVVVKLPQGFWSDELFESVHERWKDIDHYYHLEEIPEHLRHFVGIAQDGSALV
jgi:hypothetical protein